MVYKKYIRKNKRRSFKRYRLRRKFRRTGIRRTIRNTILRMSESKNNLTPIIKTFNDLSG